jgi:hypothetical protein
MAANGFERNDPKYQPLRTFARSTSSGRLGSIFPVQVTVAVGWEAKFNTSKLLDGPKMV